MAEAGRLNLPARRAGALINPVTALRLVIILAVLAAWEALAASGLLYREVVPSLGAIAAAHPEFTVASAEHELGIGTDRLRSL